MIQKKKNHREWISLIQGIENKECLVHNIGFFEGNTMYSRIPHWCLMIEGYLNIANGWTFSWKYIHFFMCAFYLNKIRIKTKPFLGRGIWIKIKEWGSGKISLAAYGIARIDPILLFWFLTFSAVMTQLDVIMFVELIKKANKRFKKKLGERNINVEPCKNENLEPCENS